MEPKKIRTLSAEACRDGPLLGREKNVFVKGRSRNLITFDVHNVHLYFDLYLEDLLPENKIDFFLSVSLAKLKTNKKLLERKTQHQLCYFK